MGREIGMVAGPVRQPACTVVVEENEIGGGGARGGGRRVRGSRNLKLKGIFLQRTCLGASKLRAGRGFF